ISALNAAGLGALPAGCANAARGSTTSTHTSTSTVTNPTRVAAIGGDVSKLEYNRGVDPAVLPILACPRWRAEAPFKNLRMPRCATCGLEPASTNPGVIDLIDVAVGEPTATTTEQRLMESELIARMYDRFWRPAFVRMLAGKGAGAAVGGLSG